VILIICEEYAQVIVEQARVELEGLEEIGALALSFRRGVAFDLAVKSVMKDISESRRQELLLLGESLGLKPRNKRSHSVDTVIFETLTHCHKLRPRIPL
jgi:hypothetical protein